MQNKNTEPSPKIMYSYGEKKINNETKSNNLQNISDIPAKEKINDIVQMINIFRFFI